MSVQAEVNTDTTVQNKAAKVNEEVPKQEKQPYTGTEKPPEETLEQINWRKFRQVREIERKAKEESDRKAIDKTAEAEALKAAMESLLNRPQAQQQVHDELDETEDQRIEKKVNQALKAERQRNDQERAQREAAELPQKLSIRIQTSTRYARKRISTTSNSITLKLLPHINYYPIHLINGQTSTKL